MINPLIAANNAVRKMFDNFQDGAEQARNSVAVLMGGLGGRALSGALQEQAEFLMGRTDRTDQEMVYTWEPERNRQLYEVALANNLRRATEAAALMSQAFQRAADESRALAAAQRGASAQYDLTNDQMEKVALNRELFQATVNQFRGGDNLRTKIESEARQEGINRSSARELYGRFAAGEEPATRRVIELLGLQSEMTKIMANDYDRLTGAARELAAIEEERKRTAKQTAEFIEAEFRWFDRAVRADEQRDLDAAGRSFDRQVGDFEKQWRDEQRRKEQQLDDYLAAVPRQDALFSRRDSLMNSMRRSEIIGAADVFGRNLNAGMKSEELKQLEEINKGIQDLKPITGLG
jgi:hypothetical protein